MAGGEAAAGTAVTRCGGPAPHASARQGTRIRNGGRHRCQPPLSGFAPRTSLHLIPFRFSCDQRPAKRCVAAHAGTIRRRFGRPPFGGRPHLESPSSSLLASAEAVAVQAMDCISCTRSGPHQLVGIAAFRDQDIGRFPRQSVRSLLASLATTLDVPVVCRLCRPMIESCHERRVPPTEKMRKAAIKRVRLWISPALATSGFAAAFL